MSPGADTASTARIRETLGPTRGGALLSRFLLKVAFGWQASVQPDGGRDCDV